MQELSPEKPKRSITRRVLRFFLFAFLFLLLFAGSLVALLFVYEDEVKAAIIAEINKHLKAEVKIDPKNIDLTIIKTFPDCTLEFTDVLMLEALKTERKDTLLFARRVNLHFNVQDLWNKRYEIETITVKDGNIKIRVLKDGTPNYIFWDNTTRAKESSTNFDLDLIKLENVKCLYPVV